MRRLNMKLLTLLLVCMFVLISGAPSFAIITTHGIHLTDMTSTAVTINWYTDVDSTGKVNYGLSSSTLNNSVQEVERGMLVVGKKHSVRITGLTPGTRYYFQTESKEVISLKWNPELGTTNTGVVRDFTTFDTNDTDSTFYFLTDVKENITNLNTLLTLIGNLSSNYVNCDFVAYGGDQFNTVESEAEIFDTLIDPSITKFARYHPFIYARGNNDYNGEYARKLKPYIPNSSGKYYSGFNQGKAAYAILDTGILHEDSYASYKGLMAGQSYSTQQYNWLQSYVGTAEWTNYPFKIAILHNPNFGYGDDGNASEWKSLLSGAGTHLVLAGNNLKYSHNYPGDNGESYHKVALDQNQVAKVNVSSTQIIVTIYDINGAIIDYFTIPQTITSYTNLALNATAAASSTNAGQSTSNGNDGDIDTFWTAATQNVNEWYKIDLRSNHNLSGTGVLWKFNNYLYQYKIQVSTDGSTWTTVADRMSNTDKTQYKADSFTANARYVRIVVTGMDSGYSASIREFKVFGN